MKTINKNLGNILQWKKLMILLLTAVVILSACNSKEEKSRVETEGGVEVAETEDVRFLELRDDQFKATGIETTMIEKRTLSENLKVNGTLDVPPQNYVSISAPYGGFLKSTELLEGSKVKKGQTIAVLEHPDYIQMQQDYMSAFSQLNYLEKEYQRQKELQESNAASAKVFQKAESEYKTTFALVKGLETKLALLGINKESIQDGKITSTIVIISSVTGYVVKVNAHIGKYINPQDAIFEIVDTEHLHVELTVFEKDISKVREGQKIRFTLSNQPNVERTATVYLIGRFFDETRSVHIHGHLDKEVPELLPGMYINAVIETKTEQVSSVPKESLVMSDNKQYIFIENKVCVQHPKCSSHENCLPEENCKEHPDCEAHEKCAVGKVCKEHPQCEAHEKFPNESVTKGKEKKIDFHTFTKIEVKSGMSNGAFIEIIPVEPINENAQVVIKGASILLAQTKSGKMDACGQ